MRFQRVKAPTKGELTRLTHTIAQHVGRYPERQGLLERDAEISYLTQDGVDEEPMNQLLGSSVAWSASRTASTSQTALFSTPVAVEPSVPMMP